MLYFFRVGGVEININDLEVQLSSMTSINHPLSDGAVRYNVSQTITHPDWTGGFENDIALLKLDTFVEYSQTALPVCLPSDDTEFRGTAGCYATGWGHIGKQR